MIGALKQGALWRGSFEALNQSGIFLCELELLEIEGGLNTFAKDVEHVRSCKGKSKKVV